jgi:hypothetical protein
MYFRQFPILHAGMSIPLAMLAPFEPQALANHQQSLARLAERGGLDATETLNVLDGVRRHREGCWSRQPPSVCRQELIERVWKWEHENADGRLVALSRIVRRTLASGQLEKLEDARPYLDEADRPEQAPRKTTEQELARIRDIVLRGSTEDLAAEQTRLSKAEPAPQGAPYECNCPAPYPEAVHDLTCPEHLKRFPEDAR